MEEACTLVATVPANRFSIMRTMMHAYIHVSILLLVHDLLMPF